MQGSKQPRDLVIESSLPKPWEVEATFHDTLYDWMSRAPWLAISGAAHLLVFFLLMAIPWDMLRERPEQVLQATILEPEDDPFEEEEPEEPEEIEDLEPVEEPELQDETLEPVEEPTEEPDNQLAEGDPTDLFSTDFDAAESWNDVLGIGGGGPPGKFGARGFGRGRPKDGGFTEPVIQAGLQWLAAHQAEDGSWDCDGFSASCGEIGSGTCEGHGYATHDVGVTGLALLAFLGMGHNTDEGAFREVVADGIRWLRDQQDESGRIGPRASDDFLYDHALATLALCENYYFTKSPMQKRATQEAVWYLGRTRNDYGAWRYDDPPVGDNDTSVTGWALFALAAAKDAGLMVDEAAFVDGLAWIDEVTDPATGRVGYDSFGSLSSRNPANEHFPREKGEAMTAVGLLCRIFLGQTPEDQPILTKHADLLRRMPPVWDPEGFGCDMYYWYYGTYAMFQLGGSHWKAWRPALKKVLEESQRTDGDAAGSWDPIGPWGHSGGRVYSTAIMTLAAEVYFRYAPLLGAR
ncbi:MAG: prenyltransferase/squalene oxidase repeat-containing protein [Planctomycetota bacterium]